MDEVREFCLRVLGDGPGAIEAAEETRAEAGADRVQLLAAAARACRARAGVQAPPPGPTEAAETPAVDGLAAAVARELAVATARLPDRQREALAARELLGLSYDDVAAVMGIDRAAVAPLLARARLRLRAERRGSSFEAAYKCTHGDRALRALALRQDGEALDEQEDGWLFDHLGECEECSRAHAAMLEASFCYRAWPTG
jgi:sigma-70-like protein